MRTSARARLRLAARLLPPLILLVGVATATSSPAAAADSSPIRAAGIASAANPGDPALPNYSGLADRVETRAAVATTPLPCDDNGEDRSVTRDEAITRARTWLAVGIPYSQERCYENQYGDYRTDCSGFVSMAWGLGGSGDAFWTGNLDTRTRTIARSDLKPGDALLRHTGDPDENHVALFLRWEDSGKTQPRVIEQTGSQNTVEDAWSASKASDYTPVRYDNILESTSSGPSSGVSGDFNGDDKDDIVARSASTGELWLYPGTGSLTTDAVLGSKIRIGTGWGQYDLIFSGDFNRDGRSDIVGRRPADGSLWVYSGTGSFTTDRVLNYPPVRVGTGWNQFNAIFSGDFNQDGISDVVARRPSDGSLVVYPGTGSLVTDGVVRTSTRIGIMWNSFDAFTAGDFNQDGKSDIVARRPSEGILWLYPGTGSLTADGVVGTSIAMGHGWNIMDALTTGDFNRDGKSDIVGRKTTDRTLWVYPGTGSFTTNRVLSSPTRIGVSWGSFDRIS
ncbi:FG-GAP-like repeat-containing protein [Micromonospora sp. CA-249363]|uniref:C40 family peptidase n=1 Tax=Micromonospora sp. CA-249363 TaxID=3239963 RepID=UPI003D8EEC28